MAFTGSPVDTAVVTAQEGDKADPQNVDVKLRFAHSGVYTHAAGAGTGEINLVKLPGSRYLKVWPQYSHIKTTQFATNADLHLGHRAYTNAAGTAVAEDDDEWMANVDVGGGAIDDFWAEVTGATAVIPTEYDAPSGLEIYAMIDTGNIEDDDTIEIVVAYSTGQ